jgi:hypothetical protein
LAALPVAVALLSLVAGAGCASRRGPAHVLATAGVTTAAALEQALRESRTDFARHIDSLEISAALAGGPAASDEEKKKIAVIQAALGARARMFHALQKAYSALGKLASYDASAEVAGAATGLVGAVQSYGQAIGAGKLPAGVDSIIRRTAGLIAEFAQTKSIVKASAAIRESLTAAAVLMEEERGLLGAAETLLRTSAADAASDLFRLGLGKPSTIVREQLGGGGLELDERQLDAVLGLAPLEVITGLAVSDADRERIARENQRREVAFAAQRDNARRLRAAVDRVIVLRTERRIDLYKGALGQNIEALRELQEEHRKLESGDPLDLQGLAAILAVLRGYAEDLAELRRGARP